MGADGSEIIGQKEEVEMLSRIPFSKGPFKTKEGDKMPRMENLYLNSTMRRFVLGEDAKTGKIDINGTEYEVRQARHSAEDGRIRNILHPNNVDEIRSYLSEGLKVDPELEQKTGVKFYCGEFKTKEGARFPEGRTIYATAKLRKVLGVDEVPGSIEIDGVTYKVRQGKKPVDGGGFVNVVHPVEELKVQQYLAQKLRSSLEISRGVKAGAIEVLDHEVVPINHIPEGFLKDMESRKAKILTDIALLQEKNGIEDEVDQDIVAKAVAFIENPTDDLEEIMPHTTHVGMVLGGYEMEQVDPPPAIDAMHAYLFTLQCINRVNFVASELAKEQIDLPKLKKALFKLADWTKILQKGYEDSEPLLAAFAAVNRIYEDYKEKRNRN